MFYDHVVPSYYKIMPFIDCDLLWVIDWFCFDVTFDEF